MELRGPVLCAVDMSETADEVLRQAYALSQGLQDPLVVCHVLPEAFAVRVLFPQDAGLDTSFQAELTQKAIAVLRTRVDAVIGAPAASVSIEIDTGTAHAGILEVAARVGAGIIVVGPGSTALQVARTAAVPLVVARPSPAGGDVLGATDFSDPALPAVTAAADQARRRGVGLRLVHCLDIDQAAYVASAGMPGAVAAWPWTPEVTEDLERAARERLVAAARHAGVTADTIVTQSGPATGILHAASSLPTALVVVGTRGRTGLSRLALGSVAESVITRAACSVLVVPLHPA